MPSERSAPATPAVTPFAPHPLAYGGHVQTFLGYFSRRKLRWTHPTEDLIVESEDGARTLSRVTWQPGARRASPALILLHGMGGSDDSNYMLSVGQLAYEAGYHVVRMNMRGAGASFEVCARLYHAGVEGDLVSVIRRVARDVPRIALFGVSLGANHVLLALGRSKKALPRNVRAAVAVSPPLDLVECSRALHARSNRLYVYKFLGHLKNTYAAIQRRSDDHYEAGREIGVTSVSEFDERITAPYGGFASADDYYRRSSSGPYVRHIEHPTLILSAADDPMIPVSSIRNTELPASGHVSHEILPTGGHVGFTGPTSAPGGFWAAERALSFLAEHV